jgi:predicted RNA-binding Zn-ribbon protein involved in translation (DUF1610 family)
MYQSTEATVANDPLTNTAEVELVCPSCGYRMARTAARLRRETKVVCPECGVEIVPGDDDDGAAEG